MNLHNIGKEITIFPVIKSNDATSIGRLSRVLDVVEDLSMEFEVQQASSLGSQDGVWRTSVPLVGRACSVDVSFTQSCG